MFFLVLSLPNLTLAEINYFQLKTLLKICETAQHSSDHGTIKNIASQLKDAERPSDEILAKKYDECLLVAFGKSNIDAKALDMIRLIAIVSTPVQNRSAWGRINVKGNGPSIEIQMIR